MKKTSAGLALAFAAVAVVSLSCAMGGGGKPAFTAADSSPDSPRWLSGTWSLQTEECSIQKSAWSTIGFIEQQGEHLVLEFSVYQADIILDGTLKGGRIFVESQVELDGHYTSEWFEGTVSKSGDVIAGDFTFRDGTICQIVLVRSG